MAMWGGGGASYLLFTPFFGQNFEDNTEQSAETRDISHSEYAMFNRLSLLIGVNNAIHLSFFFNSLTWMELNC